MASLGIVRFEGHRAQHPAPARFDEDEILAGMAVAALILGILLLILIARTPKDKPLFSGITKVMMIILGVLWLLIVTFFAVFAWWQLPYMLGQAIGTLLILAIFAGIGMGIRRHN